MVRWRSTQYAWGRSEYKGNLKERDQEGDLGLDGEGGGWIRLAWWALVNTVLNNWVA
jgi:hypothetical protein